MIIYYYTRNANFFSTNVCVCACVRVYIVFSWSLTNFTIMQNITAKFYRNQKLNSIYNNIYMNVNYTKKEIRNSEINRQSTPSIFNWICPHTYPISTCAFPQVWIVWRSNFSTHLFTNKSVRSKQIFIEVSINAKFYLVNILSKPYAPLLSR